MLRHFATATAMLVGFGAGSSQALEVEVGGFVYDVARQLECVECGVGDDFFGEGPVMLSGTITTSRLGTITSGDDIVGFSLEATTEVSGLGPLSIIGTGFDVGFFGDGALEAREGELEFGGSPGAEIEFSDGTGGGLYQIFIGSFSEQVFGSGGDFFIQAGAFDQTISSDVIGTRVPDGPPPPGAEVPLPAAGWMMIAGLAALVGARRRRAA